LQILLFYFPKAIISTSVADFLKTIPRCCNRSAGKQGRCRHQSSSLVLLVSHSSRFITYIGYLLVIVLPTNCVSLPAKHVIPFSLSTCLNSSLTTFHPDPCVLPIQNLLTRPPGITSNFSSRAFSVSAVCTFYLELSTCTHSFYRVSTSYPPLNAT